MQRRRPRDLGSGSATGPLAMQELLQIGRTGVVARQRMYFAGMRRILWVLGAGGIVLSYGVLFVLGPAATDAWVEEDRIVESAGALALLATSVLFLLILLRGRREGRFGTVKQLVLLGLVILFFIGAGEEISWGQRYLGLATPAELKSQNTQGEINFHNLKEFSGWLSTERMFQLFWIGFGVVIPVVAAASGRARAKLDRLLPVLPVWVAVYLIFNQVVASAANLVNDAHPDWYEGRYYDFSGGRFEVTESVISLIFAFGAYAVYRRLSAAERAEPVHNDERAVYRRLAPTRLG